MSRSPWATAAELRERTDAAWQLVLDARAAQKAGLGAIDSVSRRAAQKLTDARLRAFRALQRRMEKAKARETSRKRSST